VFKDRSEPFAGMPSREIDVLRFLLKGWKTSQIADTLNLSISTISTLKSRIFQRTQTNNIKELMDLAALHRVY
jgi:DNA-binding NarL/FixJ family response regulator